ncbi:MAG: glycoside hydrolase family 127 protein [Tepidisphaeraceae bacterium]
MSALRSAPLTDVKLNSGLLAERQRAVLDHSIEQQYQQCKTTGRLDALSLPWKPDRTDVPKPHEFWDSDIAKWIESAAYALVLRPDAELEAKIDAAVEQMARTQMPDGYFNSFFQAVAPNDRWKNLRDRHELYCAGHLIEAAVAYFQATGKRAMLDVLTRYVDHIDTVFGPEKGKKNGYDGHEEIELALIKLYGVTKDEKHLKLARHFIDARGAQPHFFDEEAIARGDDPKKHWSGGYDYYQAHVPVREQTTAEGHSVRAMYLYAGVADVAALTGDAALLKACRRVFDNVVNRRMYITGGIGSSRHGERFTYDFDLPNESAYAETCAQIALIFFAQRMLLIERDAKYADIVEHVLYNGVLCGCSLDGSEYFYANYLSTDKRWHDFEHGYKSSRQGWFGCACCPPNYARLLTSIGSYAYSVGTREIAVNLYGDSTLTTKLGDASVTIQQKTKYPWDGDIELAVKGDSRFALRLRLPGWCAKPAVTVNGKRVDTKTAKKGYLTIDRAWTSGDVVRLSLPMEPRRVYADPRVRQNVGRVALMRGSIVYCIESRDNGIDLGAVSLPSKAKLAAKSEPKLLGGVVTIVATGQREPAGKGEPLYRLTRAKSKPTKLKFIPYYAWANRGPGEMSVWVRES